MIFPISDLNVFSSAELVLLFGNPEEDWSRSSKLRFTDYFKRRDLTECVFASFGAGNQSRPWVQCR